MFNKKLMKEIEELKKEIVNLKDENLEMKTTRNIMCVRVCRRVRLEKEDELGRVYETLRGGNYYYDADKQYFDCSRDSTERQFIQIIDITTHEIVFLKELHEDEYFTITKES